MSCTFTLIIFIIAVFCLVTYICVNVLMTLTMKLMTCTAPCRLIRLVFIKHFNCMAMPTDDFDYS